MTTEKGYLCCHSNALLFIQPDGSSLMNRPNTPSKTIGIPSMWVLLGSQSIIDVICNNELLTQISQIQYYPQNQIQCGDENQKYQGTHVGYRWMWFYPEGIANILSMSRLRETYIVAFDSAMGNCCFHVHKIRERPCNFRMPAGGCVILTL